MLFFSATLIRKNYSDSFQDLNRCPMLLRSCNLRIQQLPTALPKATGFAHPRGLSGDNTRGFPRKGQYRHRAIRTRQLFLTRKSITPTLTPGDQTRSTREHNPSPLIVATQRRESKVVFEVSSVISGREQTLAEGQTSSASVGV